MYLAVHIGGFLANRWSHPGATPFIIHGHSASRITALCPDYPYLLEAAQIEIEAVEKWTKQGHLLLQADYWTI